MAGRRRWCTGIVGAGKARVNVTADVDMAHVTTQKESFDPDGPVGQLENTTDENSKESQADGSGQSSAAANIPGTPNLGAGAGGSSTASGRQESTTNYEITKTTSTDGRRSPAR